MMKKSSTARSPSFTNSWMHIGTFLQPASDLPLTKRSRFKLPSSFLPLKIFSAAVFSPLSAPRLPALPRHSHSFAECSAVWHPMPPKQSSVLFLKHPSLRVYCINMPDRRRTLFSSLWILLDKEETAVCLCFLSEFSTTLHLIVQRTSSVCALLCLPQSCCIFNG